MSLRRTLSTSLLEGALAELIAACATGGVTTAWALWLGLSPCCIGLLGALPATALIAQPATRLLGRRLGNRTFALWATAAARQCVLPLALLPVLPISQRARQVLFVAFTIAGAALNTAGNSAWTAWMAELVPGALRPRYFARRGAACALAAAVSSLAAGLLLDGAARHGRPVGALCALSVAAAIAGAITTALLRRQMPARAAVESAEAARPATGGSKLIIFAAAWSGAAGIAAAFYPLHMIETLGMGFTGVALYGAGVALSRTAFAPAAGRALERLGARAVLIASALGLAVSPALWLATAPGRLWPLAIDAALTGATSAGLSQAMFELPLLFARPRERASFAAALSAAGGAAAGVAAAGAAAILRVVPAVALFGRRLAPVEGLFLLGAVARALAALLGLRLDDPAEMSTRAVER